MIITDKGAAVAARVMQDLNRGMVKRCLGRGCTAQTAREVLISALTETEVDDLKYRAVNAVDPQGFVVVLPTSEIAGRGFSRLDEDDID